MQRDVTDDLIYMKNLTMLLKMQSIQLLLVPKAFVAQDMPTNSRVRR